MPVKIQLLADNPVKLPLAIKQLSRMDVRIANQMRKDIRKHARIIIKKQKQNIRSMPVRNTSHDSRYNKSRRVLRREVAKGVHLSLRFTKYGVSGKIRTRSPNTAVINHGSKVRGSAAMLPRGLDKTFTGWTAPYFGDVSRKFHHEGRDNWFMEPPGKQKKFIDKDLERLLNAAALYVINTKVPDIARGYLV